MSRFKKVRGLKTEKYKESSYIDRVYERLKNIDATQRKNVEMAGKALAKVIRGDRLIYVFGAGGHTSLVTGEMFFRVGGLANIYPVSEMGLTAFGRARTFLAVERFSGLGEALIRANGVGEGDALLLFHTIGVTGTCIEAAKEAGKLGAVVIGIASSQWQDQTPMDAEIRASGKENLRDLVDIYIDDCNTVEDAGVWLDGIDVPVGPLSGIGSFAIAHMVEMATIQECLSQRITPPVWGNANTPEGAEKNKRLLKKYETRIPFL